MEVPSYKQLCWQFCITDCYGSCAQVQHYRASKRQLFQLTLVLTSEQSSRTEPGWAQPFGGLIVVDRSIHRCKSQDHVQKLCHEQGLWSHRCKWPKTPNIWLQLPDSSTSTGSGSGSEQKRPIIIQLPCFRRPTSKKSPDTSWWLSEAHGAHIPPSTSQNTSWM